MSPTERAAPTTRDDVADDVTVLGLDAEAVEAWLQEGNGDHDEGDDGLHGDEDDSTDFVVWPENWDAVQLFLRCGTQWVWNMTACVGLDYARVESVMRMTRVPGRDRADMLDSVRVLESAALTLINDRNA